MKMKSYLSNMVVLLTISLANVGCGTVPKLRPSSDLQIYDYKSGKVVATVRAGRYAEMLCNGVRMANSFFTISQNDDHLIFRRRSADGEEIARYELPLLETGWVNPHWYSLSPDGTRIAYWLRKQKELHIRNLKGSRDTILLPVRKDRRARRDPSIDFNAWRNGESVVVAFNPRVKGYKYLDVYKISVSGAKSHARLPYDNFPYVKMSPNGRYLCGIVENTYVPNPDWSKGWQAIVFDLDSMRIHGKSRWSKNGRGIAKITWADDSRSCFFEEHVDVASEVLSRIVQYRISDSSLKTILGPEKDLKLGIESNGSIIMGRRGEWKLYDWRKKAWGPTVKLDANIIGTIPGTTRWILSDW